MSTLLQHLDVKGEGRGAQFSRQEVPLYYSRSLLNDSFKPKGVSDRLEAGNAKRADNVIDLARLTLMVKVLLDEEGRFVHADCIPKTVAADDEKIFRSVQLRSQNIRFRRYIRFVRSIAC